ncbi:COG3904 family protein [Allosphingosinicella deserti]|uniref:Uncharacterized protein n=1 Tax=Allosphingosinicella deserti TaxID=2116704 RepID=A0A2P7QZJ6_9SPHN|nr:hypothetical protein [Sphingomonas deserti]PSJ43392.1 hypothetical protein C7I55_03255 [Sphingomonas deserti]
MNNSALNDMAHFAGAAVAALVLGLLLSWALDRLLLRRLIDDRIAGIALSCAIAFVLLMAGTTLFLTLTLADYIVPGIVVPPMGIALSYLAGLAVAGTLRMWAYGKAYEEGDEQLVFDPDHSDHSVYDAQVVAFDERYAGRNYLVRHWAGNLSLPMSYWVNGALLSTLILAGTRTLAERIQSGSGSLQGLAIVILAYLGISAILWVWSSVGIWRSAYWHRRRGGTPAWAVAARAMLVITAVATLLRSGDIALQAAEFGQLATGRDSMGAIADMTVSKNGRELILAGSIASGAAKRFETVLQAHPGVTVIVLTSPGGRILEAERIAAIVRARRLDTRVDKACMSACTNILLAGRERTAEESARIGFHAPNFPGFNAAEMQASVAAMRNAYLAAGVDPAFVARALTTPAETMWFPSFYELESAGVLTGSEIVIRRAGATAPVPALDAAQMQRELQAAAAQTNASAPTRLDEATTLTRATASGLTLTHYYMIEGAENLDVADGRRVMTKMLSAQACRQPQVAKALRDGVRFVHSYSTTNGRHLFDAEVTSCPKA